MSEMIWCMVIVERPTSRHKTAHVEYLMTALAEEAGSFESQPDEIGIGDRTYLQVQGEWNYGLGNSEFLGLILKACRRWGLAYTTSEDPGPEWGGEFRHWEPALGPDGEIVLGHDGQQPVISTEELRRAFIVAHGDPAEAWMTLCRWLDYTPPSVEQKVAS